jgi:hypothetical protein
MNMWHVRGRTPQNAVAIFKKPIFTSTLMSHLFAVAPSKYAVLPGCLPEFDGVLKNLTAWARKAELK